MIDETLVWGCAAFAAILIVLYTLAVNDHNDLH